MLGFGRWLRRVCWLSLLLIDVDVVTAADLAAQPVNVWIKRSPIPDGPVSPRLGYEGACVWDRRHQLLVRYGGHNQGGGGEQGAEVWTFEPSRRNGR